MRTRAVVVTTAALIAAGLVWVAPAQAAGQQVDPGSTSTVRLGDATGADGTGRAAFTIDRLPASGSVYAGIEMRAADSKAYIAQARVYASGKVTLSIKRKIGASQRTLGSTVVGPGTFEAGDKLAVRLTLSGSSDVALSAAMFANGRVSRTKTVDSSSSRITRGGAVNRTLYVSGSAGRSIPFTVDGVEVKLTGAAAPDAGGAAKPTPKTYGVPAGVTLQRHDGNIVITKPNTVIDGLEVHGTITVMAPGAVIRNSRIVGGSTPASAGLVNNVRSGASFTVRDSELVAKVESTKWNGIMGSNFVAERLDVHGVVDPIRIMGSNVTVRDSWLHDSTYAVSDPLRGGTPTHDDSIQIQAGTNIRIEGNVMEDAHNAAIQITQDTSRTTLGSVVIADNTLDGGGCTVNIARTPRVFTPVIRDNRFGPNRTFDTCNVIAPAANTPNMSGNVWVRGGAAANGFTLLR